MKRFRTSNIISFLFVLFYCWTLQYNVSFDETFSGKEQHNGKKYFVELQNTTNAPIFNYKLKLNNITSIKIIDKILNVIFDGAIALRNNLSNILEAKIFNFLADSGKSYVFKDFRICFPFHFFY
ncbi:MAG: hypothetical protein LBQ22_09285 [Bacteroidales bacterium]|nr:hypothetical protein [Bacteroidales bacterium]